MIYFKKALKEDMFMRITFFGSSHGVPEPNRKCSCALIEAGNGKYFIDMGTNATDGLRTRGIPVESVKAVFVTHMHGDHTNGLIPFIDICTWKFRTAAPKFFVPTDAERFREAVSVWIRLNGNELREFSFSEVSEGAFFRDENIKVTAFKTKHTSFSPSYAYLIEAEGKRVLFSGDLSHRGPTDDFPVSVLEKPLDLAICEAAHFKATDYMPLFEGNENLKALCFNHYSDRFLESVIEMTRLLPDISVTRAADDMIISL